MVDYPIHEFLSMCLLDDSILICNISFDLDMNY